MDQVVLYFTNLFHTLATKLGIKDSKWHMLLKYHVFLHIYIKKEVDFMDISFLVTTYHNVVKIEKKNKLKKWEFVSTNLA